MQFTFLFWRLLAGHFIGDFTLQTDTIFKIKVKYPWGVILHGSIAGILICIMAIPYLSHYPILWLYLFLNIAFHILVDKAKLSINPKVKKVGFIFFLLDQIIHIAACWLISISVPSSPHYGASIPLYGNTTFMIFISVYIAVTYGFVSYPLDKNFFQLTRCISWLEFEDYRISGKGCNNNFHGSRKFLLSLYPDCASSESIFIYFKEKV